MGNNQSKLLEPFDDIEHMPIPSTYIPMPRKTIVYKSDTTASVTDPVHEADPESWTKYTISKQGDTVGVSGIHEFEVYCLVVNNNNQIKETQQLSSVYMKPVNKTLTYEFEEMFNFGIGCDRYDKNKVIQVVYPQDYVKYLKPQ